MLDLFIKGGPLMWPLLLCSILSLTVTLERVLFLILESSRRNRHLVEQILTLLERGDRKTASQIGTGSSDFIVRALLNSLTQEHGFNEAMLAAANRELRRYNRGLTLLDTVITLAPLLGLLGTVTGMIGSFGMLGGAELGAPAALTGGIAEALIATAFGLGVAISSLIPFNYLHSRQESARFDLEEAASKAELSLRK